ncbi:hypothetical protein K440DRAFT_669736 [Wilcoxina mikolae CBS 423.85]|nr:hypothetical protein K440DRAFT_669736 [Wilcoxina mikolae CBS 423.85]
MGSSMDTDFSTTSDISLGSPTTSDFISTCYNTDSSTDSDDFVFKFPQPKPRTPSPTDSEIFSRYTTLNSTPIEAAAVEPAKSDSHEELCNCPHHEEVQCSVSKSTYYSEAQRQVENQPTNTHSIFDSTSNSSFDDTINPTSLSKPFLNSSIDAILIPSTPRPTPPAFEPPPPTATVFPTPLVYDNIDGPSKEIKQFWWCCMCSMVWEYEVGEWDGERCPGMGCEHQRCTRCGWTRRSFYNH